MEKLLPAVSIGSNYFEPKHNSSFHLESPHEFDSFKTYILRNLKFQTLVAFGISVLLFIALKLVYPHANFIPDSDAYIAAARKNLDVNIWPIGYSKFLRIFSTFTKSDLALVVLQFAVLQTAACYLLFTIGFYLKLKTNIFFPILYILLLNPLAPIVANFVTADALFISFSLIWMTQLIWLIHRPNRLNLYSHGIVLLLCFMLRYNALFYPFISFLVIVLIKVKPKEKLISLGIATSLLFAFIVNTMNEFRHITGKRQFSPFSGWQLAANAMFGCRFTEHQTAVATPALKELNDLTWSHYDSLSRVDKRADEDLGIYYLWKGPLRRYRKTKYPKEKDNDYFTGYAKLGPLYEEYGKFLIRNYPLEYVQNFIGENAINYFFPPPEFLNAYNMELDSASAEVRGWFNTNASVIKKSPKKLPLIGLFPFIISFTAMSLILLLLFAALNPKYRVNPIFRKTAGIMCLFFVGNIVFSISASPIVLRYQIFPFYISLLLIGIVCNEMILIDYQASANINEVAKNEEQLQPC